MFFPALRRHLVEPLHGLMAKGPKLPYWHKIEKTQYLPKDMLETIQWERLREILEFAYNCNPFYKERFDSSGLRPSDIRALRDLEKIPLLTKKEIQKSPLEMLSHGYSIEKLLKFKTGGSTGKSLEFYITEDCSELRNACARRHDRWSGWEVGEPVGAIWGNPVLPKRLKSKLRNWLLTPTIYLDTMQVTDKSVRAFADEWKKYRPTLLFGHAHSIYVLAQYALKLNIKCIKPRGIISSSMMLLPHERNTIETVFEAKVFDRYGCEEVSLIASECEMHEGMHLNIEHLFVEFIKDDGEHASPGEPGRIIVTDLVNKAMPFIRYEIEDVGVPSSRKCSCGRGLPLMEKVTGRIADFLIKVDGTRIAGVSLIENTLTKIPGIEQMQIIQESLDSIVLNIVPGPAFNSTNRYALLDYFRTIFGSETRTTMELVEEIKPERSGKYRFSICKVPQP